MQFTAILACLASVALALPAEQADAQYRNTQVSYSPAYDIGQMQSQNVVCSSGSQGLLAQGFSTLGEIPNFPMVAAIDTISWGRLQQCGLCFRVIHQSNVGLRSIYVQAVDASNKPGFILSRIAMKLLT
ncbi:Cerato-platanin-domain-containing protein, partial [Pyronema domesticum]